jgi:glycosyltransferase involved in cell wall biosynthesis
MHERDVIRDHRAPSCSEASGRTGPRVCLVCPSYPPQDVTCGVGDYTRCLAEELARQGVGVTVLASDRYRGGRRGSVEVRPVIAGRSLRQGWRIAGDLAAGPGRIFHLQYAPDLYGERFSVAWWPLLARLRAARCPTVVTCHALTGRSLLSKVSAAGLLMSADWVISANEEVSAMIRRRMPFVGRWCSEIPIGSNIPVSCPTGDGRGQARSRFRLPETGPLAVHFGMVYQGKGLETLFEAVARLHAKGRAVHLAIAGDTRAEDRAYRRSLDALAQRLGIDRAVTWTGRLVDDEVSRLLGAADLYVVPYDEGVSVRRGSLIAGLAHGLPVISTRPPHRSAYLEDGRDLVLVAPRDPAALAEAMDNLLEHPDRAGSLGRAARDAAARFSWEQIARETRAVYARLLSRCESSS